MLTSEIELKQQQDYIFTSIFEKLQYMKLQEACDYASQFIKSVTNRFELTKGQIIRILSLKFLEENNREDLKDKHVVDTLFEIFEGHISKRTIYNNIVDELKDPVRIEAGRKGGKAAAKKIIESSPNKGTVQLIEQDPQFISDSDDGCDDEAAKVYSPDANLLSYPKLESEQVIKLDKQTAINLDIVIKASTSHVYLIVDSNTQRVTQIYTDKEYDKSIY